MRSIINLCVAGLVLAITIVQASPATAGTPERPVAATIEYIVQNPQKFDGVLVEVSGRAIVLDSFSELISLEGDPDLLETPRIRFDYNWWVTNRREYFDRTIATIIGRITVPDCERIFPCYGPYLTEVQSFAVKERFPWQSVYDPAEPNWASAPADGPHVGEARTFLDKFIAAIQIPFPGGQGLMAIRGFLGALTQVRSKTVFTWIFN